MKTAKEESRFVDISNIYIELEAIFRGDSL